MEDAGRYAKMEVAEGAISWLQYFARCSLSISIKKVDGSIRVNVSSCYFEPVPSGMHYHTTPTRRYRRSLSQLRDVTTIVFRSA